jgi:NADPH:quinone reductase-like Zn-dependent oxidoreductase
MQAVNWNGKRDVRLDEVPDPTIESPTDAIVGITSTGICGSDLHLYEVLGPFMGEGDVLGHEPMGIVEEVGGEVSNLAQPSRSCFSPDRSGIPSAGHTPWSVPSCGLPRTEEHPVGEDEVHRGERHAEGPPDERRLGCV